MLFSKENCPYNRQTCILMEALLDDTSETSFSSSSSSNCTYASQTDSGSVASCSVLHSSSLTTRRLKTYPSKTSPSLNDSNHSEGQSIDLGNAATCTSRNLDIDHALSQASSCRNISDTESCINDRKYAKYVPQVTKLPSPIRQENFNPDHQMGRKTLTPISK